MKKLASAKVIVPLELLALVLFPSLTFAQQPNQGGTIRYQQKIPNEDAASRQRQWLAGLQARDAMHKKERLVRRAYLLLMRYHRADNAEKAARAKSNHEPEADVQFELRNMHTGPIEEILDQPISDLISLPKRDTLLVLPEYYYRNDDPKHVSYRVQWSDELPPPPPPPGDALEAASGRSPQTHQSSEPADAKVETTAREFLANTPDFSIVELYTSYEVMLKLAGRERHYRAMVLHYVGPPAPDGTTIRFVDWIVGPNMLSRTLRESLPPVRSPWSTYVKSAMYRAVVRAIRKAQQENQPLFPIEGPLDYLPGDDAVPDARDEREAKSSVSASAVCQAPYYTLTISPASIYATGTYPGTTATVTVQTYPALSNLQVILSLAEVVGAGGHTDHAGNRPLGTLAATQGMTGFYDGAFRTTYTSSIFGGEVAIYAQVPALGGEKGESVRVGVGLTSLAAGATYILYHNDPYHPAYHNGTATALTNLPLIANDYKAQFYPDGANGPTPIPDADKLNYNDMSLVNGGKFEAFLGSQAAWGPDVAHQEHRVGINCDVRNFNVPTGRRAALEEIFRQRGSPTFLDEGNHWHLRFQ